MSVKAEFGLQLRRYREGAAISQEELAVLLKTSRTYISKLERGLVSVQLETINDIASVFGVKHYQLLNPTMPAPLHEKLPALTRKALNKLKQQQGTVKDQAEKLKRAQKEEGIPGRAKQLLALVDSGFFKKPKTAKEAFMKLNSNVSKKSLNNYSAEIGKITVTLGQGRLIKRLDKLEPVPGSAEVRFVIKDPAVVKYFDGPTGTKDMAADKG